jgi:orotidine-5'-phosphate decarboxylase
MVLIVAHYVLQQRLQRQPLAQALARTNAFFFAVTSMTSLTSSQKEEVIEVDSALEKTRDTIEPKQINRTK